MNNINKLIEQGAVLARKHEELRNETLNDPNVPQEIKDALIQAKKEFEEKEHKEELEINKHKKIKGYNPDNFEPIYEDEHN
jgi:hypothetical protein